MDDKIRHIEHQISKNFEMMDDKILSERENLLKKIEKFEKDFKK